MLVTFSTQAYADISMFGDVALAMLRMMGHSETVPGAILAEDVPGVLNQLTAAIAADKHSAPVVNKHDDEPVVSMANRGLPLVKLLTAAKLAHADVMWK